VLAFVIVTFSKIPSDAHLRVFDNLKMAFVTLAAFPKALRGFYGDHMLLAIFSGVVLLNNIVYIRVPVEI
jgi:hypothetical protein